jgi:hypothetical protein
MRNFRLNFIFILIYLYFFLPSCSNTIRVQSGLQEQLDTTVFIEAVNLQLRTQLGIPDSLVIFYDDVLINKLRYVLYTHKEKISAIDFKYFNRLQNDTLKYDLLYGEREKIPFPVNSSLLVISRGEFRFRDDREEKEQWFFTMFLPYYVGESKWLTIAMYINQWGHGEYYGLIVEHQNGKTEILNIFNAGAS